VKSFLFFAEPFSNIPIFNYHAMMVIVGQFSKDLILRFVMNK
jgi:hypothetical protein